MFNLWLYIQLPPTCVTRLIVKERNFQPPKKTLTKKGFLFPQSCTVKSFLHADLRTWNNYIFLGIFSDEINVTISPQFFFFFLLFPYFLHFYIFFLSLLHCIFQSETFLKCLAIGKGRNFRKLKGSNRSKAWVFQNLNIN